MEAELSNTASYSGWLFSTKDKSVTPHQVEWHTLTGWPNIDDTMDALMPAFTQLIDEQVMLFLNELASSGSQFAGG